MNPVPHRMTLASPCRSSRIARSSVVRDIGGYIESSIPRAVVPLPAVHGLVGLFRDIRIRGTATNPKNHFLPHSHMREIHRKAVTPFSYCG